MGYKIHDLHQEVAWPKSTLSTGAAMVKMAMSHENGKRKEKKLQEAMPPRSKFCHVGSSTKAAKIIDYPSSFIVIGPHCPTQYSFIH